MMRCVLSLVPVVLTVALSGCSRENVGERLTRECREVADAAADPENTTNHAVATVKRTDMEAVIRSDQWGTIGQYRRRTRRDMARRIRE
jgi:hypothetical protein